MEEFKSDQLSVKLEKKENCIAIFHIKASKELCEKAKHLAIKEVNKEVSVSGFRKGKAPDEYILKQYPENVNAMWQKQIGDLCFIESEKLVKMLPLSAETKIDYNLEDFSEKEANLTFTFEVEPTPPEVDPKKFQLKEIKKREIKEKDIDEVIRQARFFYAKWHEIERPIQENDYVILDLESLENNKKVFKDTRFEIKKGSIAKWMKDLLIGAKKGDIIEGVSYPDEDLKEEEKLKFKSKKVKITVKKVEEVELPPLDDEFAKKMKTNDLEDLKRKIKENLEKRLQNQELNQKREQVNQFLLKNYPFDLPKSLVNAEFKFRKDKILQDKSLKTLWEKASEKEKQLFEENILKDAKESILLFYHAKKITKDANISVTKEEVDKEAKKIIIMQTPPPKVPDLKNIPEKVKALALSKLYMQKMQDYILYK